MSLHEVQIWLSSARVSRFARGNNVNCRQTVLPRHPPLKHGWDLAYCNNPSRRHRRRPHSTKWFILSSVGRDLRVRLGGSLGREGSEQILLAVRVGIGWVPALLRYRREGAHQLQGMLVADKNCLQFLTAEAAALDGADPIGFRIEHRMALALTMPFHSLNLQHFQAIISPFGHICPVRNSADANKASVSSVLFFRFLFRP